MNRNWTILIALVAYICVCLIAVLVIDIGDSFYGYRKYQSSIEDILSGRRNHLINYCSQNNRPTTTSTGQHVKQEWTGNSIKGSYQWRQLVVVPDAKLLYCWIPKTGSSQLLWYFENMNCFKNQSSCQPVEEINTRGDINWMHDVDSNNLTNIRYLVNYEVDEIDQILHSYKKLVVVRDPLDRVVSAWRDKMGPAQDSYAYDKKLFFRLIGKKLIEKYRGVKNSKFDPDKETITIEELFRFLNEKRSTSDELDEHWRPMFENYCHFCGYSYDYILHLETISSELDFVLAQTMGDRKPVVNFSKPIYKFENDKKLALVHQIPLDLLKDTMEKLYGIDYLVFQYERRLF